MNGSTWLAWLLPQALQVAVVALVVALCLHLPLARRAGVRLALLAVLGLKLACPLLVAPTSLFGLSFIAPATRALQASVPGPAALFQQVQEPHGRAEEARSATSQATSTPPAKSPPASTWADRALLLYLLGVLVGTARMLSAGRFLHRIGREGRPLTQVEGFDAKGAAIRTSDRVSAPICFGILRPTILLPEEFEGRISAEMRRTVLLHERTHLALRDPLWLAVARLLRILWWFHPAVWWLTPALRRVLEDRCDERLLATLDPVRYGETLLAVASRLSAPSLPGLSLSMAQREHVLAARLRRILDPDFPKAKRTPMSVYALPLLLAITLVPAARPAQDEALRGETGSSQPSLEQSVDRALAHLVQTSGLEKAAVESDALTLLALLGGGETSQRGPHHKELAKLRARVRDAVGTGDSALTPGEALAAAALAEHYVLNGSPREEQIDVDHAVTRAVATLETPKADLGASFWSVMTLLSAETSAPAMDHLQDWFPLGTTQGAAGWSENATRAASVFLYLATGGSADSPDLKAQVHSLSAGWEPTEDPWGTELTALALFQVGGPPWHEWNASVLEKLESSLREDGSFPASSSLDARSAQALLTLALEVRHRYARVVSGSERR